jgi:hypothetical protein
MGYAQISTGHKNCNPMKTISLTMLQVIRLAVILDNHQGQRKDLRMLGDLRERLSLSDEKLNTYITPLPNGFKISEEVLKEPNIEIALVKEEARKLLEIIDVQTLTVRDLVWVEPLVDSLVIAIDGNK